MVRNSNFFSVLALDAQIPINLGNIIKNFHLYMTNLGNVPRFKTPIRVIDLIYSTHEKSNADTCIL